METPQGHNVCLYHRDCFDGMMAAYIFRVAKFNEPCLFIAADYTDEPPEFVKGARVFILDFSYELDVLKRIALNPNVEQLVMIDHHPRSDGLVSELGAWAKSTAEPKAFIDLRYCPNTKSGAAMTWEYFFKNQPMPSIVAHVSDRDIWKFEQLHTAEVMAGLGTYKLDLGVWMDLFQEFELFKFAVSDTGFTPSVQMTNDQALTKHLRSLAPTAGRIQSSDIDWVIENTLRMITISWTDSDGAHKQATVPLVNCPKKLVSDTLHQLGERHAFAMAYFDLATSKGGGRRFSIRSQAMDIRPVAREYGGDGHPRAAGFTVPRGHWLARI